jgi:hypothetical protein
MNAKPGFTHMPGNEIDGVKIEPPLVPGAK